jgi:FMN phosphatase YigB (HAD superfamily)
MRFVSKQRSRSILHESDSYDYSKTLVSSTMDLILRGEVKFVSIDIFDTILLRTSVTPWNQWKDFSRIFAVRRFTSEWIARAINRSRSIPEVTISNIYKYMGKQTRIGDEEDFEFANFRVNPEIIEFIRFLSDRQIPYIFISDTHFSSLVITKWLEDFGISRPIVFTSSDHLKTKYTGLFYEVAKSLNLNRSGWLHIGDNPKSDYKAALDFKIQAYLYPRLNRDLVSSGLLSEKGYRWLMRKGKDGRSSITFLSEQLATYRTVDVMKQGGLEGLIGFSITASISESVARYSKELSSSNNSDLLWFVSRDGWIPFCFFQKLFPDDESHYFKVSRQMLNDPNFPLYVELSVKNAKRIQVFDLGWRGSTIQRLRQLQPDVIWSGVYWALLRRKRPNDTVLFSGNFADLVTYWRSRDFIELLFSDPSRGYSSLENSFLPLEKLEIESDTSAQFRENVLNGAMVALRTSRTSITLKQSNLLLKSLSQFPSRQLMEVVESVNHDIRVGLNGPLVIRDWKTLLSKERVLWPQGSKLSSPTYWFESTVFKAILTGKEVVQRLNGLIRGSF